MNEKRVDYKRRALHKAHADGWPLGSRVYVEQEQRVAFLQFLQLEICLRW
jgi:hypothetical protein